MKHLPFDSIYRSDFHVVEERRGNLRLYPHTEQLPVLLRAIHHEFYGALPPRIARADHRATDFEKIALLTGTVMFCNNINGARKDELRLYSVFDRHLVARPAIVQQITESDPRGRTHRFRFYTGDGTFLENHLCGRRVVFADHVLQRFGTRTNNFVGEDLSRFLITFFDNAIIGMQVGQSRAFVVDYHGSILALPYKEVAEDYFVLTCLTVNEMNSLELEYPPHAINVHYHLPYVRPSLRNWVPAEWMLKYHERWQRKVTPQAPGARGEKAPQFDWKRAAQYVRDFPKKHGRGPGSKFAFADDIPGPVTLESKPGQPINYHNEIELYQKMHPDQDWHRIIAERVEQGTFAPPIYPIK